ncbi:hypothetical protein DL93DRAFT_2035340, partial [Clavulina sp. PMI_390]
FNIMLNGKKKLKFNICQIQTSFFSNSAIPDLHGLIDQNIGEALIYACHFWTSHLAFTKEYSDSTLEAIKTLLSSVCFFYWLEVMSLTGASP